MSDMNWKKVLVEFIGTFVFLSVILNVAMNNNGGIITPIAVGIALTAAIYMFGSAGDNHFNPAVSFMAWIKGDIVVYVLIAYIIAQILGGCGAFVVNKYLTN